METLVAALIAWIVAKTGLTAPDTPRIVQLPIEQMVEMTGSTARPQAIYVRKERTIYLRSDWTPDTLLDRATLLHELVHHLQEANNVQKPCERAQEADAYHLELDWLKEQGVDDPYKFLDTNESQLCSDQYALIELDMSAPRHKRTAAPQKVMSALHPIADIAVRQRVSAWAKRRHRLPRDGP